MRVKRFPTTWAPPRPDPQPVVMDRIERITRLAISLGITLCAAGGLLAVHRLSGC